MVQKRLSIFTDRVNKEFADDLFVHLTIYDVPVSLLKEFAEKVVNPFYPEGVSTAIKDLMRKAIANQDFAQTHIRQVEREGNG